MKRKIKYSVSYEVFVDIPDDKSITEKEIQDYLEYVAESIDIPENSGSKYVEDSFEVARHDDGNIRNYFVYEG